MLSLSRLKEARHANHALFVRMFVHILPRVLFVTEVYQELMQHFVALLQPDVRDCWIQQKGASSHTARSTVDM
jgi:hypothetical protein